VPRERRIVRSYLLRCGRARPGVAALVAAGACLGLPACRGRAPVVAHLTVSPRTLTLPYPECTPFRLAWRPIAPLDRLHGRPRVFLHLVDRERGVLRTFDHELPLPWHPGEPQEYAVSLCQSGIAASVPPGSYDLTGGLYDSSWGYRWLLDGPGEEVGRREYRLATVVVPAPGGPSLGFGGSWTDIESGTDQQVLARRWLFGPGSIAFSGISGRGAIVIDALVSEGVTGGVALSTTCGRATETTLAPGHRSIELEVEAGPSRSCLVTLTPRHGPAPGATARGALCLELVAWRPEPG